MTTEMVTKQFGAYTIQVPKAPDDTERIYSVEVAETGNVIEDELTYDEACALIKAYETEDFAEGNYTRGFYAIRNSEMDECKGGK